MLSEMKRRSIGAVWVVLAALAVLLISSSAFAAGRIQWKSKTLEERNKSSWVVELEIHMPRPPDVAHLPMNFEFEPTVYYERSMVDGDKLVERKVPLTDRQPMIESVDVGFLDPGSGKIEKRTRFSFKLTRARGYEAGEYKVTVRDARSGNKIGTPTTLIFKGENEVIDRRAMVFSGESKKKQKQNSDDAAEKSADSAASNTQKVDLNEDEGSAGEGEPAKAKSSASEGSMDSDEAALADDDEPQTIQEKPGGCGCRTAGTGRSPTYAGLSLLALGLLLVRRRGGRALTTLG